MTPTSRICALLADARLLRPRLRGIFPSARLHRGRAAPTAETPRGICAAPRRRHVLARTRAGGAAAKGRRPRPPRPLAHLVCKFALGEPPKKTGGRTATRRQTTRSLALDGFASATRRARGEPRPLHLALDALHRAGPMNLLHQIAPREGHEAVHEAFWEAKAASTASNKASTPPPDVAEADQDESTSDLGRLSNSNTTSSSSQRSCLL